MSIIAANVNAMLQFDVSGLWKVRQFGERRAELQAECLSFSKLFVWLGISVWVWELMSK
jgi:hypothetical protein